MITCPCEPGKVSDCASTDFVDVTIVEGTLTYNIAQTTLDMRRAANHSAVCIAAGAPISVNSTSTSSYSNAFYTLSLYRSSANSDFEYPPSALVAQCITLNSFYGDAFLALTPQLVATGPPDVYTAVLTMAVYDEESPPDFDMIVFGRINLSATVKTLPSS